MLTPRKPFRKRIDRAQSFTARPGDTFIVAQSFTAAGDTFVVAQSFTALGDTFIVAQSFTAVGDTFIVAQSFTAVGDTFIVVLVNVAEATVEVQNRLGLHLRAASALAQTAAQFKSKIMIGTSKEDLVSAKSMTSLMMLGAAQGSKLKLRAEGEDAREALKAVQTLFDERFGEE